MTRWLGAAAGLLLLLPVTAGADGEASQDAAPAAAEGEWSEGDWDDGDWLFDDGPDPAERDDIEGSNRAVFGFNEGFYRYLANPVTAGFEWLVPDAGRRAIHRFFVNLDHTVIFVNDVLQLAPLDATKTASRFVINTTVGLLGFFDVATPIGIPFHHTDFGETLAVYGTPSGSYVVIPIVGPSTARDTFGELVDFVLHPTVWFGTVGQQVVYRASGGISEYDIERQRLDALRSTSVDFYAAIRSAYLMDRDAQVATRVAGRWWNGPAEAAEEDGAVAAEAP